MGGVRWAGVLKQRETRKSQRRRVRAVGSEKGGRFPCNADRFKAVGLGSTREVKWGSRGLTKRRFLQSVFYLFG